MREIRAFRGLRFTDEAGAFGRLLSPPSDRVAPEEREHLAAEPNNIVHASMPPGDPDDRSKFVRYARASAQLAGWRRNGTLTRDEPASLYRLAPIADPGASTWLALAALTSIPVDEPAPVKARDDRLRMLEATRTYFEPIALITGPLPSIEFEATTSIPVSIDGVSHTLEIFEAPFMVSVIEMALSSVEIARNEFNPALDAARAFREAKGERTDPISEDYVLAAIGPDADRVPSGLVLWNLGDRP